MKKPELSKKESQVYMMTQNKMEKHIIDCDKTPTIPSGFTIEKHIKGGILEWNPAEIILHLEPEQEKNYLGGNVLRERLKTKPVLNACVLDYLLEHQDLIPKNWKNRYVFFWGTIYGDSDGNLCVRSLCFRDGKWRSNYSWLENDWYGSNPAALRVSSKPLNSLSSFDPLNLEIKLGEKHYKLVEIK